MQRSNAWSRSLNEFKATSREEVAFVDAMGKDPPENRPPACPLRNQGAGPVRRSAAAHGRPGCPAG